MTMIMLITPLWCVPFSGGSRISQRAPTTKLGVKSYYFGQYFAESCMEMKEIRPRGAPHGSANVFGSSPNTNVQNEFEGIQLLP